MINRFCCLTVGWMLFSAGYGQSDKLLLKNGSLLYGSIETLNSDEVRLTVENETLRFPYSSIRMVRLRKNKSQNIDHNVYKELRQYSTKGIQVSLQAGYFMVEKIPNNQRKKQFPLQRKVCITLVSFFKWEFPWAMIIITLLPYFLCWWFIELILVHAGLLLSFTAE